MRLVRLLLAGSLTLGCSVLEPLDDYTGGPPRDSGPAIDTGSPIDSQPIDTGTEIPDSTAAETGGGDSGVDSEIADTSAGDSTVSETAGDATDAGDSTITDSSSTEASVDSALDVPLGEAGCTFDGVLVKYDFAGKAGSEPSVAAAMTPPSLVASDLTRTGLIGNPGAGAFNSSGWSLTLDKLTYVSFKLTPAAGCKISPAKLTTAFQASATGPKNAVVGTSIDAYATTTTPVTPGSTGSSPSPVDIVLTGSGAPGDVVEVRIYGYGGTSMSGTMRISGSITVSGKTD